MTSKKRKNAKAVAKAKVKAKVKAKAKVKVKAAAVQPSDTLNRLPIATQPSVAVKIVLFTAIVYLFVMAVYLIGRWFFLFQLPDELWDVEAKWVVWGAQILVLAGAVTVATKLFLVNPINRIKGAIKEVSRGDFFARAEVETHDEIGDLAAHFDQMLTQLTELNADKMQTEYELLLAREELSYKSRLEKRGKVIKMDNKALESLVKDFSLLYEIGQCVNSAIEISELYRVLQEVLPKRLNLQKFAILLVDERREFLNIRAAYGFDDTERIYDLAFRIGEGISGEVALEGELIYLPDVEAESKFLHYRGESVEKGSFLSIPLRFRKDILGVMNCSRPAKDGFAGEEIRLLTLVANQIALAVENAQLYTKTRELSVRDELTGLYNRRHFQQVLQMEWKRATRFRRPLSLLMIDIDHFKEFNDTFGHPHGDKVLKLVGSLLARNLREVDTLARFGGEEFVVLLPDTDKMGAHVVGEKLRRLVETERFDEEHRHIMPLTVSVGISVFLEDAREMDDLIDHADVALYEAKDGGRNRVVVYADAAELVSALDRPTLVTD